MDKAYFSIKEAAIWSSLSPRFLYELCQNRKLRFSKIGRRIVLAREDLEELIHAGTIPAIDWDERAREFLK